MSSKGRVIARYNESGYRIILLDGEGEKTIMKRGNHPHSPERVVKGNEGRLSLQLIRRFAQTTRRLEAKRLGAEVGYAIHTPNRKP